MKKLVLLCTHLLALAAGFAIGIYMLPILIAPASPAAADLAAHAAATRALQIAQNTIDNVQKLVGVLQTIPHLAIELRWWKRVHAFRIDVHQ